MNRPFRSLLVLLALGTFSIGSVARSAMGAPGEFTFKRGVSIAHWLAKVYDPAGPGAPWFQRGDVQWIADQGFDHIRVPFDPRPAWHEGKLDEAKLAPLAHAMGWAREFGLGTVVDMHFLPGGKFDKDNQDPAIYTDARAQADAVAFMTAFARRFSAEGPNVRFELVNEPFAPKAADLNRLNTALIAAVRSVDRVRFLYVTCNDSSTFATLPDLQVPADPRVGIIVHYDEPEVFTHQRAGWKQCPPNMPPVPFPGRVPDLRGLFPPDHFAYKASGTELTVAQIEADFSKADAWLKQHAPGREIYLGEFGCYEEAPADSRRRYIHAVSSAAARRGWGWAVWSYHGSFTVRADDGRPTPVLEGLFPKS